ncbi:MAG: polyphenol oxidase family protein, partial [Synergistes sp.]|nr:polyphenol oxidase family protein [Synergistes sp.]
TLQNFAGAAIDYARKKHPDQKPGNIFAWIGPAIGRECYSRKNDDPTTALALKNFAPQNVSAGDALSFFDLKGEIAYRLSESGVERDKIFVYDCCTHCRNDLFYSYRAGDDKKRIFLLAGSAKKSHIL